MNEVPQYRRKSAWRTQRGRRRSCIEPLEERALLTSIIDLGTLPDGIASDPTGINDSGQVVGYSLTGANVYNAFLYSDGLMFDLVVLPGDIDSRATGINASGQVVGYSLRILHPITSFSVAYNAANDSVALTFTVKQSFRTGGQIKLVGGSSSGVTGVTGTAISGNVVFGISPGGGHIKAQ